MSLSTNSLLPLLVNDGTEQGRVMSLLLASRLAPQAISSITGASLEIAAVVTRGAIPVQVLPAENADLDGASVVFSNANVVGRINKSPVPDEYQLDYVISGEVDINTTFVVNVAGTNVLKDALGQLTTGVLTYVAPV